MPIHTPYEIYSANTGGFEVNQHNVGNIRPECGVAGVDGGLFRPYGSVLPVQLDDLPGTRVQALDELNAEKFLPMDTFPLTSTVTSLSQLVLAEATLVEGAAISIHHRKGNAAEREQDYRRLLLVGNPAGPQRDWPSAMTIWYFPEGHPDHPREPGFYLRARHIGRAALATLDDDNASIHIDPDTDLLPHHEMRYKFFPIPQPEN